MALWVPVFFIGMVLHESLHAIAVLALGSHPVLVVRPWTLALAPLSITGIHIQPVPQLDPTRQALDNVLGPGVAAVIVAAVAAWLRPGPLRLAVIATVLGLLFYTVIEPLDVVLDGRLEVGFLTAPEFNYGVPALLALMVSFSARSTKSVASTSASGSGSLSATP